VRLEIVNRQRHAMVIHTASEGMGDWHGFARSRLLTRRPLNVGMHFQEKARRIARRRTNEASVDLNANALALRLTPSFVMPSLDELEAPANPELAHAILGGFARISALRGETGRRSTSGPPAARGS
jgi:hypothetical protein